MANQSDYDTGFDGLMPVITDADAYAAQYELLVSEIADDFDAVASELERSVASELDAISSMEAEIILPIFDAADQPLQQMNKATASIVADLDDAVKLAMADAQQELASFVQPLAVAGCFPPPADPFNGSLFAACRPENSELLQDYMQQVLDWIVLVDPIVANTFQTFISDPVGMAATSDLPTVCGQVTIYRCAPPEYQPPTVEPPIQPPTTDDGTAGNALVHTEPLPIGCQQVQFIHDQDPNYFLLQEQYHLSNGQWIYLPTGQILAAIASAGRLGLYVFSCPAIQPPLPPEQEPEPEPEQEPEPEVPAECEDVPSWVQCLCDCLNRDRGKKLEVWVQCETCEIKVIEPDKESFDSRWQKVADINETGEATYNEQCKRKPADENGKPKPAMLPEVERVVKAICKLPATPGLGPEQVGNVRTLFSSLSFLTGTLSIVPTVVGTTVRPDGALIGIAAIFGLMDQSIGMSQKTAGLLGCSDDVRGAYLSRQWFGLFERILPGGFGEVIARLTQFINQACPSLLPTVDQATRSYIGNTIDDNEWSCWVRANGYLEAEQRKVRHAVRTRPGVNELNMLRRRRVINDAAWADKMRGVGVTEANERDEFFQLTEQRPSLTDIIRFMVRDADDPAVVQRFNLDAEFNAKYGGQLRQWAEDQGVPEDIARYAWRSHWSIPSPTQLYEMFHRLGRDAQGNPIPQFLADIKAALVQQDIAPFWIDRVLDISYRLPTRVDVRRAYRLGILTEQDVFSLYVKSGYETQVADALTKFSTREKQEAWANHSFVKAFARGELSEQELRQNLADLKATPDAIGFAVTWGQRQLLIFQRKQCLKAVRRRVFVGEIDEQEAIIQVVAINNDQQLAISLVKAWFCERAAASRELNVRQVLRLFREQVIDAPDLYQRLLRLRYAAADATALTNRAIAELQRTLEAAEQKRLAKLQAMAEKQQREQERLAKQAVQEAAKTERARQAATKAARAREVKVMEAAKVLSNRMKVAATEVYGSMLNTYRAIVRNGYAPADQAADMAIKVAGDTKVEDFTEWQAEYIDALSAAITDEV